MSPQLLIVGHIVKDIQPDGSWVVGGGALYAAAQASKLGIDTAVVTACEPGVEPETLVPGVQWHVKALEQSIQFQNAYTRGRRTQNVLSESTPLALDDILPEWRDARQILLTPVFNDISPSVPAQLVKEGTTIAIGAQGWLRSLEGDRVVVKEVEPAPEWLHGDIVFLSEEDVLDPEAVEQWLGRIARVVLTRGPAGCTVWDASGRHDVSAPPSCENDATGAGDVFATAFLVRYGETSDVVQAARFGAAAAALAVEGAGIQSVADRAQVEARMRAGAQS